MLTVNGPLVLNWSGLWYYVDALARRLDPSRPIWGVPAGGTFVALMLNQAHKFVMEDGEPRAGCQVVDDIVDSGRTLQTWKDRGFHVDALLRKPWAPDALAPAASVTDFWVQFPWEHEGAPESNVTRILSWLGEDPNRPGLKDTPRRFLAALRELTSGDHESVQMSAFEEKYDQLVIVRDIPFWSLCEHHLFPFHGTATVGYLPKGKVLGLSKVARLVHARAARLQVQERLTQQVAEDLMQRLEPLGAGCLVKARHTCMEARGVKAQGETVTSCLLGSLRTEARAEFLALAQK